MFQNNHKEWKKPSFYFKINIYLEEKNILGFRGRHYSPLCKNDDNYSKHSVTINNLEKKKSNIRSDKYSTVLNSIVLKGKENRFPVKVVNIFEECKHIHIWGGGTFWRRKKNCNIIKIQRGKRECLFSFKIWQENPFQCSDKRKYNINKYKYKK